MAGEILTEREVENMAVEEKESGNREGSGCSRQCHLWVDLQRLRATHLCGTAWEIRPSAQWPCGHLRCQTGAQPSQLNY